MEKKGSKVLGKLQRENPQAVCWRGMGCLGNKGARKEQRTFQ
jgi:hypothetical protein